ncbi:MAG: response regulator transcription factor [Burkholderiaceae bacterium]
MRLLLIEDDCALQTSLKRTLERRGMRVQLCGDGQQALALWREQLPNVVLLDLSLPGIDGLEVLAQARQAGLATPVLILTARGTVGDRVIGLNTGADDYLAKPFDLDELEARVRALHRRSAGAGGESADDPPACGQLRLDTASGAVHHGFKVLELAPRELRMLRTLMERSGRAVAKEQLFELVFQGEPDVHYEAIEVVAYRLRKKLAGTGATLVTLRGLGYLLKDDD